MNPMEMQVLERQFPGIVLRQGNPAYKKVSFHNGKFDDIHPTAIIQPSREQLVNLVNWLREHHVTDFTVRGGGHHYEGFSKTNGLVIDLTRIKTDLSKEAKRTDGLITTGGGNTLGELYAANGAVNRVVPAGTSESVGMGHVFGGGLGDMSMLGYMAQNLQSVKMVTYSGKVLEISEAGVVEIVNGEKRVFEGLSGPDAMKALRGGGPPPGIVTDLTFKTHDTSKLDLRYFEFASAEGLSQNQAVKLMGQYQDWQNSTPYRDSISSKLNVVRSESGKYDISISGVVAAQNSGDVLKIKETLAAFRKLNEFPDKPQNMMEVFAKYKDSVGVSENPDRNGHTVRSNMVPERVSDDGLRYLVRNMPIGDNPVTLYAITGAAARAHETTSLPQHCYVLEIEHVRPNGGRAPEIEAYTDGFLKTEYQKETPYAFPNYPSGNGATGSARPELLSADPALVSRVWNALDPDHLAPNPLKIKYDSVTASSTLPTITPVSASSAPSPTATVALETQGNRPTLPVSPYARFVHLDLEVDGSHTPQQMRDLIGRTDPHQNFFYYDPGSDKSKISRHMDEIRANFTGAGLDLKQNGILYHMGPGIPGYDSDEDKAIADMRKSSNGIPSGWLEDLKYKLRSNPAGFEIDNTDRLGAEGFKSALQDLASFMEQNNITSKLLPKNFTEKYMDIAFQTLPKQNFPIKSEVPAIIESGWDRTTGQQGHSGDELRTRIAAAQKYNLPVMITGTNGHYSGDFDLFIKTASSIPSLHPVDRSTPTVASQPQVAEAPPRESAVASAPQSALPPSTPAQSQTTVVAAAPPATQLPNVAGILISYPGPVQPTEVVASSLSSPKVTPVVLHPSDNNFGSLSDDKTLMESMRAYLYDTSVPAKAAAPVTTVTASPPAQPTPSAAPAAPAQKRQFPKTNIDGKFVDPTGTFSYEWNFTASGTNETNVPASRMPDQITIKRDGMWGGTFIRTFDKDGHVTSTQALTNRVTQPVTRGDVAWVDKLFGAALEQYKEQVKDAQAVCTDADPHGLQLHVATATQPTDKAASAATVLPMAVPSVTVVPHEAPISGDTSRMSRIPAQDKAPMSRIPPSVLPTATPTETKMPKLSDRQHKLMGLMADTKANPDELTHAQVAVHKLAKTKKSYRPEGEARDGLKAYQKILKEAGLYDGDIDGIGGRRTKRAGEKFAGELKAMQPELGAHKVDGKLGPETVGLAKKVHEVETQVKTPKVAPPVAAP